MKKFLLSERNFFILLFLTVLILFKQAFTINFFLDDFFFLKVGRANSFSDFFHFFWPVKSYFYRPIPTELFYFIIHLFKNNLIIGHIIAFSTYFVGLYYAYKSLYTITKNILWSRLSIFLYAISFIHVFQLYQLATFIEVSLFTFLSLSFYFFLRKKIFWSIIFFICACMSKESAALFPIFLMGYIVLFNTTLGLKKVIPYFVVSLCFAFIYKFGVSNVTEIDTYKLQLKPKLGLNNLMWYSLWSVGFPNFMPDYFVSIFKKPIPEFWKVWKNIEIRIFAYALLSYLILFLGSSIAALKSSKKLRKIAVYSLFLTCAFVVFISPTLFIIHKWMVRLTVPLIFISIMQAYVLALLLQKGRVSKILGTITLIAYFLFTCIAIPVHESSSTYNLETHFVNTLDSYFTSHKEEIVKHRYLYFQDQLNGKPTPWGGSQKLKVTLHDQDFLDYYFPHAKLTAIYGFENKNVPMNSYILPTFGIVIQ